MSSVTVVDVRRNSDFRCYGVAFMNFASPHPTRDECSRCEGRTGIGEDWAQHHRASIEHRASIDHLDGIDVG